MNDSALENVLMMSRRMVEEEPPAESNIWVDQKTFQGVLTEHDKKYMTSKEVLLGFNPALSCVFM